MKRVEVDLSDTCKDIKTGLEWALKAIESGEVPVDAYNMSVKIEGDMYARELMSLTPVALYYRATIIYTVNGK
jgi:hypothetical protein